MENRKYKIIIFTLVVILIAAIAMGVAFYLKYVNVKNNEPEIAMTSQITTENCTLTTIDELTYKVEYEKSKHLTEDESIEKTLKIGDYTVKVKTSSDLIVNGNKLFDLVWEPDIYMLDGNLIFVTGATDIRSTHVLIVNKEGELVKEIYNLDSDYSDMVIADANGTTEVGTLTINKEGIKLKGTRLTHGGAFESDYDKTDYSGEPWGEEALKRHINEPVYGTYEIKYLGNDKFGELTNTGYTLYKESDIKTSGEKTNEIENQATIDTKKAEINMAYYSFIQEMEKRKNTENISSLKYRLINFDNDEIPELVVSIVNPDKWVQIYKYDTSNSNGKITKIIESTIGGIAGRGIEFSPKQSIALIYDHDAINNPSYSQEYYEFAEDGELKCTYRVMTTGLDFTTNENLTLEEFLATGQKSETGKLLYSNLNECHFEPAEGNRPAEEMMSADLMLELLTE